MDGSIECGKGMGRSLNLDNLRRNFLHQYELAKITFWLYCLAIFVRVQYIVICFNEVPVSVVHCCLLS